MTQYRVRRGWLGWSLCGVYVESRLTGVWSASWMLSISIKMSAGKVTRDPALLDIPRNNLKRWRTRWSKHPPAWFNEWSVIMKRP